MRFCDAPSMPVRSLAAALAVSVAAGCTPAGGNPDADVEDWIPLFNGRDLDGWTTKITGHEAGVNFGETFRVQDGLLQVRYDRYERFDDQFGHLFYERPFSHYRIAIEYRFVGVQQAGGPSWARRNSGAMLHSQSPNTMLRDQDFPISVEVQFLGGLGDGEDRPTANMCSPGTDVVLDGRVAERHCVPSASATYDGDQWVRAEVIVLGDSLFVHIVNGDTVMQYERPRIGGGVVNGHDEAVKVDGTPLTGGFIALQSESHPIDFRLVTLLDLQGCTDPAARNFKRYYVVSDPSACDRM